MDALSELFSMLKTIGGVGGIGAAIYCLLDWLGKIKAARILEAERHQYSIELEHLKTQNQAELERLKVQIQTELAIYREKYLGVHRDKIELYRAAVIPLIELVTEVQHSELTPEFVAAFDRQRLGVHAHLALFAPQDVLDAHDHLVDYIFDVLDTQQPLEGVTLVTCRTLGFDLINRMRADIGMTIGDVTYRGRR